jgi:hypothetical protein
MRLKFLSIEPFNTHAGAKKQAPINTTAAA